MILILERNPAFTGKVVHGPVHDCYRIRMQLPGRAVAVNPGDRPCSVGFKTICLHNVQVFGFPHSGETGLISGAHFDADNTRPTISDVRSASAT